MVLQRLIGCGVLLLSIAMIVIDNGNAGGTVLSIPLALYMVFTHEYILGGDEMLVRYYVIDKDVMVDKVFDSYAECRNFVNRIRHSKKCKLVIYPTGM